jgi:polyhydroxybutyrate depolymerase
MIDVRTLDRRTSQSRTYDGARAREGSGELTAAWRGPLALLLLASLAACGSSTRADRPGSPTGGPGSTVTIALGDRPFAVHIPRQYHPGTAMPLVVLLHGYSSDAAMAEGYFKLTAESDRRGFLYAMPDGTRDTAGNRFWNATEACCDFYHLDVDDSGYLHRLLDTVKSRYPVDSRRVYLIGHSNGGFMAYRMACEHATEITAIVSLAGAAADDPARCTPARPVSVLQIHGTADQTISFGGGTNEGQPYPSVTETLGLWRHLDGCSDLASTAAPPIDVDANLPGPETTVTTYLTGCRDGTRVVLWSIADGGHVPALTATFTPAVIDFLLARVAPR